MNSSVDWDSRKILGLTLEDRKHWSMVLLSFMEGWGSRKGSPEKPLRSVPCSERFFSTLQVSG